MARTIESPGIEIKEIDLTLRAGLPVGTNVFVQGYTDIGPTDELINVTSLKEFEQVYGTPTNAAERYMYHTAKQVLQSPANLLTNRLPYGLSGGVGYSTEYSAVLYPITITAMTSGAVSSSSTYSQGSAYEIGDPVQIVLSESEYLAWESGQISWTDTPNDPTVTQLSAATYDDIGNAGLIVINQIKTTVNNNYAGYYLGVHDNTGLNDTTYDAITAIDYNANSTVDDWNSVPTTMIETALTGTDVNDSISEDLETIPSTPIDTSDNDDTIIVSLFRFGQSTTSTQDGVALLGGRVRDESFVGSMDATRMYTPNGQAESYFIGNLINDDSMFMQVKVNPNLGTQTSWTPGGVRKQVRAGGLRKLYAIGPQVDASADTEKYIGNMPTKLSRSLRLAENKDQIPIDIVCDGGLSTIWTAVAQAQANDNDAENYTDTTYLSGVFEAANGESTYLADQTNGYSSSVQNDWSVIYNRLAQFCSETRKDCLFISDALKHIFVQDDLKVLEDSKKNFSSHVYWPLKNLFGASNSNYACTYANWVKVYDDNLGAHTWIPFSGYEANIMAKMDSALQPWYAPAGLNNGIVTDLSDIAINPTQKQRDLIYRISVNPVVYFPGDGYSVWGQKTLQKKPSAFDRINVRRLFLVLEKATNAVMRYFVFEPNTVFTRTRVVNILSPIFEIPKNNEGVYDYLIVCDERNNTPQVTDENELVVDIYLKPVRTAEFILINFYTTRTDQDFTELI